MGLFIYFTQLRNTHTHTIGKVPDAILGIGDAAVNELDTVLAFSTQWVLSGEPGVYASLTEP